MAAAAAAVDWPTFGLLIPRIQALLDQSLIWIAMAREVEAQPIHEQPSEFQIQIRSALANTDDLVALEGQSLAAGRLLFKCRNVSCSCSCPGFVRGCYRL